MTTILIAQFLLFNDTSFSGQGGSAAEFNKQTPIRMESADIRISVPDCKVKVTYKFRNTSSKAFSSKMGFPEEGWDAFLEDGRKTYFKYFISTVDGVKVTTKPMIVDDEEITDMGYKVWWMKDVQFAANQTRTVVNEYQTQPGTNTFPTHFLQYIAHTADTWNGQVGSIRYELDVTGLPAGTRYGFDMPGSRKEGNKHLWYFTKLEPTTDHDLSVSWEWEPGRIHESEDLKLIFGRSVFTR
ncbi:MAG: DUF4424 family protein [Armatimonadetes bacterium]|nr:DUF4424 family protein [Armatimonadota bacterium]